MTRHPKRGKLAIAPVPDAIAPSVSAPEKMPGSSEATEKDFSQRLSVSFRGRSPSPCASAGDSKGVEECGGRVGALGVGEAGVASALKRPRCGHIGSRWYSLLRGKQRFLPAVLGLIPFRVSPPLRRPWPRYFFRPQYSLRADFPSPKTRPPAMRNRRRPMYLRVPPPATVAAHAS